ncbi:hypothetical protein FDECE_1382 [Fusarium decemcellulare]|nr:hypothetical protein FDECE_1382 [Fusarium decemcellulare]
MPASLVRDPTLIEGVSTTPRLLGDYWRRITKSVTAVQHHAKEQVNGLLGDPCMTKAAAPARLPFSPALPMLVDPQDSSSLYSTIACSSAQELAGLTSWGNPGRAGAGG